MLAAPTRALLRGQQVVLLEVGLSAAADRVGLNRTRPVLALNPRAQLRALLAERLPLYREVAVHTVPTDGRSPQDTLGSGWSVDSPAATRVKALSAALVGAQPLAS